MEDDDEFGDLYTDVLRPFATPLRSRPIDPDVNSDDEEILYGAADLKNSFSNSSAAPGIKANASIEEKNLPIRPEFGRLDMNSKALEIVGSDGLGLEATVPEKGEGAKLPEKSLDLNFMKEEDDDDLNIEVQEIENKDDDELVEKDVNFLEKPGNMYSSAELKENTDIYAEHYVIRETGSGQIIPWLSGKLENQGGPNFEEQWDSDESEDDLQIVLNDNNHGPMDMMERIPGVDGEVEDEDGDQLVIVADNGELGHHQLPMCDEQEWKGEEVGPRADGERKELGDAAKAGGGLLKIGYNNHLHHSQFKYVRPGAAPLPGAVPQNPGGIQGQVCTPISMGPGAGRGRGDCRHRAPFPMQKGLHPSYGMPVWGPNTAGRGYGSGLDFTLPSHKTIFEVDIDGFEEKLWRRPGIDISDFFNFGLIEDSWKDYCKQLEHLRLETTMQSKIRAYESRRTEHDYDPDLPPELAAAVGNQDVPSEDANTGTAGDGSSGLARSSTRVPLPVPIGRPIPVEIGSVERHPSIDTRRLRMHDSDAIIEIVCQSSNDDDVAEQVERYSGGENPGGPDDIDDLRRDDDERNNHFSCASNDQKREIVAKRDKFVSRREGDHHEMRQMFSNDIRSMKGRGQAKSSMINTSDDDDDDGEKQFPDNQNQPFDNEDGNQNTTLPSYRTTEPNKDQPMAIGDDVNDRSFDTDREDVDVTTGDALEDWKLIRPPPNKQIAVGSRVEQLCQENEEGEEESKVSRSSDDRSRGSVKRQSGDEDNARSKGRHPTSGKEREDYSHSQRGGPLNSSSLHCHLKSEKDDWRKKIRERGAEIGSGSNQSRSQMDNSSWVWADYDQDMVGSKQRDRDAAHIKRRKEYGEKEDVTYNHRESENKSRRKRDRDNDMNYYASQKYEESSLHKEMDRDVCHNRNKQSREDISSRREREEMRPVVRSVRPVEDKKWVGHSRGRDDYKGSGREYRSENISRHSDQLKKRDRVEDYVFSRSRGHENSGTSDEHRQKEGSRKGKEFESGKYVSIMPSKRNRDEQSGHISETVKLRGLSEQTNADSDINASRPSSRKYARETSLDSDEQTNRDSRRGRSKLERWTSHLERDFTSLSSSSLKKSNKGPDTNNTIGEAPSEKVEGNDKDERDFTSLSSSTLKKSNKGPDTNNTIGEAPSEKVEGNDKDERDFTSLSSSSLKKSNKGPDTNNTIGEAPSEKVEGNDKDGGGVETNNANAKAVEDNTMHLETVERLKKRSERFKLPMPSEKEALAIKKIVSEPLPSTAKQTESRPDSEIKIKPERPPRKRRWTGN